MTAKIKRIKLFGEGIYSKSAVVTRQRRLNCYLEVREDGDKSSIVCYGTPGMRFAFNAFSPLAGPARGLIGTPTALYEVCGNQVRLLSASGQTLSLGTIGSVNGLVGLGLNPTQLMIVDGSAGYVFTPTTGAIAIVGGAFPNGAQTLTQCNGFFACELPGSNEFFVSALNDGTAWNGLSFGTAVQAPDGILAVDSLGGILIPFSSGHVEFWQNVGANPEPFQYIQNSASMIGLAAVNARIHCGDSIYYLARTNGGGFQNAAGSFQIARIRGYSVQPVSTTDIDNILQTMAATSTIADCTGFSYQVDKHVFAQFNFPTANRSLLLDTTTGFWSEVQSGITQFYAARHIGNLSASAYNSTYIADYSNGNVYIPDPNTYTDNGNTIVREVVSRCAIEDWNSFSISQIYLDMQTGVGLPSPGVQGYTPQVELSIARDGRDFGVQRLFALGRLGQYSTRVNSRRWGLVRTAANLRIRMTDPVPFVITGCATRNRMRAGRSSPSAGASRAA
jgi:hypothetical protein